MRFVRSLFASAVLLGVSAGFAYAAGTDLENQIATASTPQQHEALASEYRSKAAESRAEAETHRRMAARYGTTKMGLTQKPHCDNIAKRYEENAKDYDALADAEAAEAKK